MTLKRKDSAKYAKSVLLKSYNDIDIYIEDTAINYDKVYVNIFKRVFRKKYKIENVFPIGSRGKVINKCKEKTDSITRPTLFIVDGDLFLLKGENNLPKGTFRLPFYCIENILIDHNSILEYIDEEHANLREENIINSLDYKNWINICSPLLSELFLRYAMVQKANLTGVPNVSIPVKDYCKPESFDIDKSKIEEKISQLDIALKEKLGNANFEKLKNEMISIMSSTTCKLTTYVSGKDYLYPIIHHKVSTILNKGVSHINFKQRLALKCDISLVSQCHNSVLLPESP
ncbi:DUF4435 domain-containing protein [Vibrio lentus]|uniref:DUF4435 domain-containing protein n=1 Tax=Vibrio lentus TaxID=136468 RepID=UPI000C83C262|nr:DUF4435 domain-containing protein [Vibrio lentus]PMI39914.1 hypothetical protein BCU45_23255 [Vibrio lentus]PMI63402.1 hypothetical protein BCU40_22060 [Vibrio lentus]PMJ53581.1 hypothetical protein BCU20_24115 [Vibrio lentus]PMN00254.1 hypothetical protein BCT42_23505 [Vibrio lentus]